MNKIFDFLDKVEYEVMYYLDYIADIFPEPVMIYIRSYVLTDTGGRKMEAKGYYFNGVSGRYEKSDGTKKGIVFEFKRKPSSGGGGIKEPKVSDELLKEIQRRYAERQRIVN